MLQGERSLMTGTVSCKYICGSQNFKMDPRFLPSGIQIFYNTLTSGVERTDKYD